MTARGSEIALRALCIAACLCVATSAHAHAPPYATDVRWVDTPDGTRALVRTNRGLIVEDLATESFRIVCNDAFEAALVEVVPSAVLPDGGLLVGTYAAGLLRSDASLCDFDPVGPTDVSPVDLKSDSTGRARALLLPLDGTDGGLFESDDGGASFRTLALVGTAPTALASAPSDPQRVYVSTNTTEGSRSIGHVLVSDDGGRHFDDYELELDDSELRAFVLAVDQTDRERLFVRTQGRDSPSLERLLRSEDGGATFQPVLSAEGPLTIALGSDGNVWAGSNTGLYRSRDSGATFEPVGEHGLTRIGCLALHAGALYACALKGLEFGVLVSKDGGTTFDWFLRFPDVSARADCPATSDEATRCAAAFEDWSREQQPSGGSTGAPPAASAGAAPGPEPRPEPADGCGIARSRRPGTELLSAALLALWAFRRRARR